MKSNLLAGLAAAAGLLVGGVANATTVDFSFDFYGAPQATGSFTYATGDTGVLGYGDLSAFTITLVGVTYTLQDVQLLTDYIQFAYDTSTNAFVDNLDACGFDGCEYQETLGALNNTGTDGFFISALSDGIGDIGEYRTGGGSIYDTVILTVKSSVPEPDTWALLIVGFAGVGMVVRARRRFIPAV